MRLLSLLALFSWCHAVEPAPVRPPNWAQPVLTVPVRSLYQVTPDLYRSAQPDDEGMAALEKLGIRTVLNLRQYHSDDEEAEGTKLLLIREKMDAGKLDAAALKRALVVLRTAQKPILVHCMHGADRTGAVIALYRIVDQGWTREAAVDELRHGGYGLHDGWFPGITEWLLAVDPEQFR